MFATINELPKLMMKRPLTTHVSKVANAIVY